MRQDIIQLLQTGEGDRLPPVATGAVQEDWGEGDYVYPVEALLRRLPGLRRLSLHCLLKPGSAMAAFGPDEWRDLLQVRGLGFSVWF